MASFRTKVEEVLEKDVAKSALLKVYFFSEITSIADSLQDMLTQIELLTSESDAAKRELSMARDTARTYYEKMLQSQAGTSKGSEPAVVNLSCQQTVPFGPGLTGILGR